MRSVRPKIFQQSSAPGQHLTGNSEVFGGYVMLQKTYKCKMRWGQLTVEKNDENSKCWIRLYKCSIVNGEFVQKDLREKLCFEFSESDFCGIEAGEHKGRLGSRRFICIITRDKHLIVQEAVTATDTDHDVITTWRKKITHTMNYVKSWRLKNTNKKTADIRTLHLTKGTLSVCQSLQNQNLSVGKSKSLVYNYWRTSSIQNIKECPEYVNANMATHLYFTVVQNGKTEDIQLLLDGQHKGILQSIDSQRMICGNFDDINLNHNLVKIAKPGKFSQNGVKQPPRLSNNYVDRKFPENPPTVTSTPISGRNGHPTTSNSPLNGPPPYSVSPAPINRPQCKNSQIKPPEQKPPPRPHSDRRHHPSPTNEKSLKFERETSMDRGYYTGENLTQDTTRSNVTTTSRIPTITDAELEPLVVESPKYESMIDEITSSELPSKDLSATSTQEAAPLFGESVAPPRPPPKVPEKPEDLPPLAQPDHVKKIIDMASLPPVGDDEPGYETSIRLEVTINEILNGYHTEDSHRNLDLPYSVFIKIVGGLDKSIVAGGELVIFADKLGLSFGDVYYMDNMLQNHTNLLGAEILLLHWYRTQAPVPCTLENLHSLLLELGRLDLAQLVQSIINQKNKQKQ